MVEEEQLVERLAPRIEEKIRYRVVRRLRMPVSLIINKNRKENS